MIRKISAVIVDDDSHGRRVLKALLAGHDFLSLIGEASNGTEAASVLQSKNPDVAFIDIHMPEANGFEVLRTLQTPPKVVFVTSSLSHAIDAMEIDAVDYLVKPVTPSRFAATVRRLQHIFEMEGALAERHERSDRLCLRGDGKIRVVPLAKLIAFQADGDFTRVFATEAPPVLICQILKHYEETLPDPPFLRLDRSLIVNLDRFIRVDRVTRSASKLWLRGLDDPLIIGRTATERLRDHLQRPGLSGT